jgi:hypothetical protein
MKTSISPVLITIALVCFGLLPKAQAVVPPPDGGYPNFTTAEGTKALFSLTTGSANTAVGWFSLFSNATGGFNTATGAGALLFNDGDPTTGEASENTAFGAAALLFNTTGSNNTATGAASLLNNIDGDFNTAIGVDALRDNTGGDFNSAFGWIALASNATGGSNTAIGNTALFDNVSGSSNTATGGGALQNNISGSNNTALGVLAGTAVTTANNVICIGASVSGEDVSNSCFIGNIFGATSSGGTAVFISSNGRLGTTTSSRRFKDEIKPMDQASEALFALKPVTFRYKKEIDPQGTSQLGLVAEEVEKVNPDLIVRDKEGKAYSVRYDQVNAMLLNEFLKEHRKVEKLEATVADLAAQLQKVSAQVQMNNSSARVAGK